MLRRLLLLVTLLLALPATAQPACHEAAAAEQHASVSHHAAPMPHDRSADAVAHDCLGCIPPDMLIGAHVAVAFLPRVAVTGPTHAAFAPGEASAPIPPPPKRG